MTNTKEILALSVEIADVMLRNGGEIYRIEDTVIHILKAHDIKSFDVYVLSNECTIEEGWKRVEKAKKLPKYSNWIQIFFCGLGSACYAFLFGGGILEFLFAFLIGVFEQIFILFMAKHKVSRFLRNVFTSAFVSTLSILVLFTGLPLLQDKIVIGAIMPLVPGITFTTSIRDFHNGDYLSGTIHLIDALLTALCIAVGIILPLMVYNYLGGGALLP